MHIAAYAVFIFFLSIQLRHERVNLSSDFITIHLFFMGNINVTVECRCGV